MAEDWPDWCMGYQPSTSPARLRVICGFRFEADELADHAQHFTRIPMTVWRDDRGRWSVSPKE